MARPEPPFAACHRRDASGVPGPYLHHRRPRPSHARAANRRLRDPRGASPRPVILVTQRAFAAPVGQTIVFGGLPAARQTTKTDRLLHAAMWHSSNINA